MRHYFLFLYRIFRLSFQGSNRFLLWMAFLSLLSLILSLLCLIIISRVNLH